MVGGINNIQANIFFAKTNALSLKK
ncbi:MAG: hypothetical protein RLZZ158_1851, partial [Cyanobacteriota bacterium]